jgi:hypothetical protein
MGRTVLTLALVAAAAATAADGRLARDLTKPGPETPSRPAASPSPGARGELVRVPGRSGLHGSGRVVRVAVEVEGELDVERAAFAAEVVRILADRRSWGLAVRRTGTGTADLTVTLASPETTDRLCAPLPTRGRYSCAQGGRAVLNVRRWLAGAPSYRGHLRRYRAYMVNHEVGHLLGRGHVSCPSAGSPAPVMVQQTKGLAGCRAHPWPLPWERLGL